MRRARSIMEYTFAFFVAFLVGTQALDLFFKFWEPFKYESVEVLTPVVHKGDMFLQKLIVTRNRICDVNITRLATHVETHRIWDRFQEPGGGSPLGKGPAVVEYIVPQKAMLGKTCLIQRSVSHCIDGVHTTPWPEVCFEIVE